MISENSEQRLAASALSFDSRSLIIWLGLGVIILFGSWLRLHELTVVPTWWDEHASVFSASGMLVQQGGDYLSGRVSLVNGVPREAAFLPEGKIVTAGELADSIRLQNVPAATLFWDRGNGLAFAFVLHFWTRIFGFSDQALRSLACVLGILAIPAAYAVACALFSDRWVGLLSALLVSCNELLIRYSQEVRSYSLAVVISLLATWLFVRTWNLCGRQRAVFAALYACAISILWFSHYLAGPVLTVAHLLAALMKPERRGALTVWFLANAMALALLLVWMLWGGRLGLLAMSEHDRVWLERASQGHMFWLQPFEWRLAFRLFVEGTAHAVIPYVLVGPILRYQTLMILATFAAFLLGLWLVMRKQGCNALPSLVLAGSAALGGLLAVVLAWKSGHTLPFISRYQTFYVCYQLMIVSASCIALLSCRQIVYRIGAAIVALGILQSGLENLRVIFNESGKPGFSTDEFIARANRHDLPSQTIVCTKLDQALIAGLKIAGESPQTGILIDKSAAEKISMVPTSTLSAP